MKVDSKKAQNIWIFNQYSSAPKYSTGAGERHFYIARKLAKENIKFTIFSSSYNHLFIAYPDVIKTFSEEIIDDVRFCWVKGLKYGKNSSGIRRIISFFEFALKLFYIPSHIYGKPDVILVSSMSMFPIYAAIWHKMQNSSLKIIFEIRDIWPLTLLEIMKTSKWHPFVLLLRLTEKISYLVSNHIISVLPKADMHIESVIKSNFKFTWIPNGIDIEEIHNKRKSVVLESVPSNGFVVGFCGALGQALSVELLIDVVKKLSEKYPIYAFILGEGDQKESFIERAQGNGNIIFHAKVKKNDVSAYLHKCDALYIGWRNANLYRFGVSANKYADYMYAGKPIISGGSIGNDPVKISESGLVIEPENYHQLEKAIMTLYKMDQRQRVEIGNRGKTYLHEFLNMNVISRQYLELLEKI
jgi:glycosyltransferase involved in cell wall biosynthesis